MKLSKEVYAWLSYIGAVKEYEVEEKGNAIVVLNQESTQQFELGLKMPMILGHYYKKNVREN